MPGVVLVADRPRLAMLMQLVDEEMRERQAGREFVIERLAAALRAVHTRSAHPWTVADLADEAALSRSAFFARYAGMPPARYARSAG